MKKNILCFAIICLLPLQSVFSQAKQEDKVVLTPAQTLDPNSVASSREVNPKMIKLGLKFAPNLSFIIPSTQDYSYNGVKIGGVLGLVSDFYFAEHYAFSTGFNVLLLGGKLTYPDSVTGKVRGKTNSSLSFFYFEIPVMVKMFTKQFGRFSFFGQIGFGTGFRISASAKTEFTGNTGYTQSEKTSITYQTTTIRESLLIGLGTEFHLDQSTRLFFGLGYSNSLNNVLKGYNSISGVNQKAYLNYAELNLGVMF